jgi:hypothetical protein
VNGGTTNMAARLAWRAKCQEIITDKSLTTHAPVVPAPFVQKGPNQTLSIHPSLLAEIEQILLKWF